MTLTMNCNFCFSFFFFTRIFNLRWSIIRLFSIYNISRWTYLRCKSGNRCIYFCYKPLVKGKVSYINVNITIKKAFLNRSIYINVLYFNIRESFFLTSWYNNAGILILNLGMFITMEFFYIEILLLLCLNLSWRKFISISIRLHSISKHI